MANQSPSQREDNTMYLLTDTNKQTKNACSHCKLLSQLLSDFGSQLTELELRLGSLGENSPRSSEREFYTVTEFAELVGKSIYTVRQWCRLYRIHAEKCDSGHGDSKSWKIPATELARYRNHGLLPIPKRY